MKEMNLKMSRSEVCKLMLACTNTMIDVQNQMMGTEDREKAHRLENTMNMWRKLHDKLEEQLDAFDKAHAE